MAKMLGDNVLPDSVVSRRRQVRERVRDLRRPLRRFRESNVPGPDVVGSAEDKFTDLRNQVVSRDSVVERIRARRSSSSGNDSDSGGSDVEEQANSDQLL